MLIFNLHNNKCDSSKPDPIPFSKFSSVALNSLCRASVYEYVVPTIIPGNIFSQCHIGLKVVRTSHNARTGRERERETSTPAASAISQLCCIEIIIIILHVTSFIRISMKFYVLFPIELFSKLHSICLRTIKLLRQSEWVRVCVL